MRRFALGLFVLLVAFLLLVPLTIRAQAPAPPTAAAPPNAFADAPRALDSLSHAFDSAMLAGLARQRAAQRVRDSLALERLQWLRDSLRRERQLLHLGGRTTPWMALTSPLAPATPHAPRGRDRALLAGYPLLVGLALPRRPRRRRARHVPPWRGARDALGGRTRS